MQTRSGTLDQIINDRIAILEKCKAADERKRLRVGDRVRYNRNVGRIDNIVIWEGANMYDVRFDKGGRWSYRATELHRVNDE